MRRPALLSLVALLVVCAPTVASAAGPVLGGGITGTSLTDNGNSRFQGLFGGGYKVGFEIGSRHWRSEWAFNQTILSAANYGYEDKLTLTGFSYQLSFHLFEKGFSPYIAAGLEMGLATLKESKGYYDAYGLMPYEESYTGGYLRPYAVAGVRYFTSFGLGARAELTTGFVDEFMTYSGNLAVSYSW